MSALTMPAKPRALANAAHAATSPAVRMPTMVTPQHLHQALPAALPGKGLGGALAYNRRLANVEQKLLAKGNRPELLAEVQGRRANNMANVSQDLLAKGQDPDMVLGRLQRADKAVATHGHLSPQGIAAVENRSYHAPGTAMRPVDQRGLSQQALHRGVTNVADQRIVNLMEQSRARNAMIPQAIMPKMGELFHKLASLPGVGFGEPVSPLLHRLAEHAFRNPKGADNALAALNKGLFHGGIATAGGALVGHLLSDTPEQAERNRLRGALLGALAGSSIGGTVGYLKARALPTSNQRLGLISGAGRNIMHALQTS